jgi:hypothetical protein
MIPEVARIGLGQMGKGALRRLLAWIDQDRSILFDGRIWDRGVG